LLITTTVKQSLANETTYLLAPREGVNDDVVRVVEWQAADGQHVAADQVVVVIETTKATIDVPAPRAGYLFVVAPAGSEVAVGAPLAAIASHPKRPPNGLPHSNHDSVMAASDTVVSAKARPLMEQHGLTAADFPGLAVVRSSDVERLLSARAAGHQHTRVRQFRGEAFDPSVNWDEVLDRADMRILSSLLEALRRRMKAKHDRHVPLGTLLHDRWQIARDHGFGEGTSVYDECLILGDVQVGKHCWVGPYTVLDGQGGLEIGDYVDIGAGAHLYTHNTIERALTGHQAPLHRQATRIGNCCFIAPHAIIGPGTTLGDHSFVAAGSYVEGSFPAHSYISGNPAIRVGTVELMGNRARLRTK
jgi:acetyltransferase-like isoleucine patch superfamily enzyme